MSDHVTSAPSATPSQPPKRPEKLAFVLAGGGSLGSVEVGCLQALVARDIYPDLVVGTSVGSLNGAWIAMHPSKDGIQQLKEAWLALDNRTVFPSRGIRVMLRLLTGRDHIFSNQGIRYLVRHHLGGAKFEDLPLPFFATATELDTGKMTVFHSGPLEPALLASTAIPGIFPPVLHNGHTYVDGAFVGNASLETAYRNGATTTVVLTPPLQEYDHEFGVLTPLERAMSASLKRISELEWTLYRERSEVLWFAPINESREYRHDDFSHTEELIQLSRQWMAEQLDKPYAAPLRRWAGIAPRVEKPATKPRSDGVSADAEVSGPGNTAAAPPTQVT